MPLVLAGGLAAFGLSQYNAAVQCDVASSNKDVDEAVKALEEKFVTYWPRNIMVSFIL